MASADSAVGEIPKITAKDIKYDETPIGRGGYGYVYRGVHKDLGTVAIKTMIADGLLPARHLRIFRSEGKKLWELKHSSIVRLLGLIMEESNYSLVLEYMHFGSLTAFRSDFVDIGWSLMVSIIRDVIHGMDYLHGMDPPILHLDLKSDNILINRRIRAKITDFGLSQWKTMTRTMTRGGTGEEKGRKGTVTHVPPEVWNNINTPPNKAYDVYSFGIVLWETMTGDRPFAKENAYKSPKEDVYSIDLKPLQAYEGRSMKITLETGPHGLISNAIFMLRPSKASAMVTDVDALFEKLAPSVPEALAKLEKEIQNLYSAEDLGGDTAATADSESLFDAASKLTKPLPNLATTSPQSVEMEDVGEEEDIPVSNEPQVPKNKQQRIVGLQEEEAPGPGPTVPRTDATSSTSATAQPASTQPSQQSSQTQAKVPSAQASQTQPKTQTGAPAQTPGQAQTAPAEPPFVITEEQKKALRRVLRDPVGMLLMHKDAQLCKRVFGVDLDLQKKIKDSGELLKLLEQDPLLRMELQRKGPDHIGWMFNPHRMKDEIRRKRPARTPKPEAVERMRKLREERQKRESRDLPTMTSREDPKDKKSGGLMGPFMNMFKKDKHKKMMKEPMSKYHDPYMDPMADMMAMRMGMGMGGVPPDMSYKLKRALRDPKMVRYILREEAPPRITPVDREVMEVLQDPDKLLYLMNQDPSLMETLVTTDKDAFMKIVARARGGPSRMRHMRDMMEMRGPRRMRMMYGGLERDMMDMDLEDEMMMMRDHDRYNRHRHDRELMDMLKRPGLPNEHSKPSSASKPSSTVSKPPATAPTISKTTPTPTTSTPTPSTAVSSASATTTGAKSPSPPKAATTTLKPATSESSSSAGSATTNITSVAGSAKKADTVKKTEPERPEIKSLPDDYLVKRQENIKMPVQRNTDTEPLQTKFGGFAKGFLNVEGTTPKTSESSTDPPNNVSTSQTAQAAASSTAGQGQTSGQGRKKKSGQDKSSKSSQGQSQTSGSGQDQTAAPGHGQTHSSGQGQSQGPSQSNAGTGTFRSSTSNAGQQPTGTDQIQINLNADGSVSGNFNPLNLPPGIQFGQNNTMVLNYDEGASGSSSGTSGASGQRKRSQEYKSKWKKMSKKHRSARHSRRDDITFDHVNLIAEHIGPKWIALAEEVDMNPAKLRELQLEYKVLKEEEDYDFCVRVLEDLMERKPYYTIQELISTLKEINCQKIAIKLIEYIE